MVRKIANCANRMWNAAVVGMKYRALVVYGVSGLATVAFAGGAADASPWGDVLDFLDQQGDDGREFAKWVITELTKE